jgi:hypothetical protein
MSVDLVADSMGPMPDYKGVMSGDLQVRGAEKPGEQRCLDGGGGGAHARSDPRPSQRAEVPRTELC